MTPKEFAEMYDTTQQAIRYFTSKGKIDFRNIPKKGKHGATIEILLTEKTLKTMERTEIRKPIKVKDCPAWIYRNDAMGQECCRPLETNNCGY